MGEASGERRKEREAEKTAEDAEKTVVRWERFLPRMVLRVLLVESDDSTRQIITALLRKCSYKVVAVGDGLKAWELLKGKPQNIDLILTEVDLPSISGFALLTLIMEHDICKNTPVIMMSSQDSVSTVYKCMLRGAADFLVKPVRINELRNLWQHVWRRQASVRSRPQDESVTQQKMEATAENNAGSTPSSGYVACVQRNKESIEKGSDAQSSCTKPDEAEIVNEDNLRTLSHTRINSTEIHGNMQESEECVRSSRRKQDNLDRGNIHATSARGEDFIATIQEGLATEAGKERTNVLNEGCNNGALVNTSREAIDFIGSFNDQSNCNFRSSGVTNNNNFDSSPMLDLSLRRSHPSGSVNQVIEDRQALNHSEVSAFSRYVNKIAQPLHSPASICNEQKDHRNISDIHFSDHTLNYNSDSHSSLLSSQQNVLSSATGHSRQAGIAFPSCQQAVISIPVAVRGARIDALNHTYGSVVSPLACKQADPSPIQSPGQSNAGTRNPQQVYISLDQKFNNSAKQVENYQRRKVDSSEDQRPFVSATDQSASSSFCNGTGGDLSSIGCGNNGSVDKTAVGGSFVESGNNEGATVFHTNYQRNIQREAALNKFRLKRKERCFDKKVRYESRKKLAEQRPRVKGQFVRQMPTSVATNSQCGNSVEG